jgi:hypothetical protein
VRVVPVGDVADDVDLDVPAGQAFDAIKER